MVWLADCDAPSGDCHDPKRRCQRLLVVHVRSNASVSFRPLTGILADVSRRTPPLKVNRSSPHPFVTARGAGTGADHRRRPGQWRRPVATSQYLCVIAAALVAACGSTSTETVTGPTPVKCGVSLSVGDSSIDAAGGTGVLQVTTEPECAWTAATEVSWIGDLVPVSGQGSGDVQFQLSPNPDGTPRQGVIAINGQAATVRQAAAPCHVEMALSRAQFGVEGGDGVATIAAPGGCEWTISGSASWIGFLSAVNGSGPGRVTFRVSDNDGPGRRGTIAIGDLTVSVAQDGIAAPPTPLPGPEDPQPCAVSIDPAELSIGSAGTSGVVRIVASPGCTWEASSLVPWLTITSGASGSGSGNLALRATENPGAARTGALMVGRQILTVTQAAAAPVTCTYAVTPTTVSMESSGGPGPPIAVTAGAGCAWTAASNATWLTITAGAAGSGNGTVGFSAAANPGASRTGTLTIGGRTLIVTQTAAAQATCTYTVTPSTVSMAPAGGAGPLIGVTSGAGCAWTAASNATWLTITAGAVGSGNGTVAFTVATNQGGARTGTLTIAGQAVSVTQAAAPPACTYSVSPLTLSAGATGGAGTSVAVTAGAGCAWTAGRNADWLAITSGANGSGNGTVGFTVAANQGTARTGTLTIAGQTVSVTQAAAPVACTYSISPASYTANSDGGAGPPVTVSAPAGCVWTATRDDGWLTITSGERGSGSGTVTFTVTPFRGNSRSGTLTIAGQTFTVTQSRGAR